MCTLNITAEIKKSKGDVILKTSYLNRNLINLINECNNIKVILNEETLIKSYRDIKVLIDKNKDIKKADFKDTLYVKTETKIINVDLEEYTIQIKKSNNQIDFNDYYFEDIKDDDLRKFHSSYIENELDNNLNRIRKEVKVVSLEIENVRLYNHKISIEDIVKNANKNSKENPAKLSFSIFNPEEEKRMLQKLKDKKDTLKSEIEKLESDYNKRENIYNNLKTSCTNIEARKSKLESSFLTKLNSSIKIINSVHFGLFISSIDKIISEEKEKIDIDDLEFLLKYRRKSVLEAMEKELENRDINPNYYNEKLKELVNNNIPSADKIKNSIDYKIKIPLDLSNEALLSEDIKTLVNIMKISNDEKCKMIKILHELKEEFKSINVKNT